jgi:hypothetical protein
MIGYYLPLPAFLGIGVSPEFAGGSGGGMRVRVNCQP